MLLELTPSPPQPTQPVQRTAEPTPPPEIVADPQKVLVTEWMLLDWGRSVPQWIELYNYNTTEIDLNDWTFKYIGWKGYKRITKSTTISDFKIPAESAIILATYHTIVKDGLTDEQIYNLKIPVSEGTLKHGWEISDSNGHVVYVIGQTLTNNESGNPQTGKFVGSGLSGGRESVQVYKSADAPSPSYYGRRNDIGSPGFFESIPAAPSTKRTLITKWAELRQK